MRGLSPELHTSVTGSSASAAKSAASSATPAALRGTRLNLSLDSFGAVRPRTVLVALEAVLAVALAAQAARLVWAVVTPMGPIGRAPAHAPAVRPAADLSVLADFDAFFRVADTGPVLVADDSGAGGGVVLYGVRAAGGGRGSAILGAGGAQRSVAVGEEVEPGLVLAAVAADHVVLSRGGARQRIGFPKPAPGTAVLPPASPAFAPPGGPASGPAVDPRRLLDQATLLPRMRNGQPSGYQVVPKGGSDLLRAAGLQSGDVLLAVDGVVLTPERVGELPKELAASTAPEIRFERGGQVMTTRLRIAQP